MTRGAATPSLLLWPRRGAPRAVVLFLPGGPDTGTDAPRRLRPGFLRLQALAADLWWAERSRGVAVGVIRYRVTGWNGESADPVRDARWALAAVERRFGPVPVALVGMSMGGRAALRTATDPRVVGVLALAPWALDAEPVGDLGGARVLIRHGDEDEITDPTASQDWARRAERAGCAVRFAGVPEAGHGLLRPLSAGRRLVRPGVREVLRGVPPGA